MLSPSRRLAVLSIAAVAALAACSRKDAAGDSSTAATPSADVLAAADSQRAGATRAPGDTMPAKADSQMQAVLDQLAMLGGKPIETLSAPEARKQPTPTDAVKALLKKNGRPTTPEPVAKVENRTIPGPGGAIPVRIYWPAGNGPFPVIVYYHGGGWVIATVDTYDATPRAMVTQTNAVVISVEYRKAPEHKFPAQHDDALAAYQWAISNAASIKGDPKRIALMGESAGGNLAVATAMAARDGKLQMPVAIASVYPIAGVDTMTESYVENAHAKPLSRPMMVWFLQQTIKSPADLADPRIDLVGHANLAGLPATTIVTDQIDPLRSEGQKLADKLKSAGVTVNSKSWDGVTHEFFGMAAVLDKSKEAQAFVAADLNKAFGQAK